MYFLKGLNSCLVPLAATLLQGIHLRGYRSKRKHPSERCRGLWGFKQLSWGWVCLKHVCGSCVTHPSSTLWKLPFCL